MRQAIPDVVDDHLAEEPVSGAALIILECLAEYTEINTIPGKVTASDRPSAGSAFCRLQALLVPLGFTEHCSRCEQEQCNDYETE